MRLRILLVVALAAMCHGAVQADEQQVVQGVIKAPLAEVWKAFSTPEGYKKLGVAKCEMDFRVGGLIRSHYNPNGEIGDDGTIQNEILAYERERMLAIRIHKPPKGFPFGEETWKAAWSVISLTDLGEGNTHLRIAGVGYPETEEGRKMRQFFEAGNNWVLDKLKKSFDDQATGPTGAAHATDPLGAISVSGTIDLPKADVWRLISSADGWKESMNLDSAIELKPGGKFELYFVADAPAGQRGSEGCKVLSVIPGQLLSFDWNAPPTFKNARERRTWVVFRLDELGPTRTRLRIDHLGFGEQAKENPDHRAEWEEVRAYFQKAWPRVVAGVKSLEAKMP